MEKEKKTKIINKNSKLLGYLQEIYLNKDERRLNLENEEQKNDVCIWTCLNVSFADFFCFC